jgi:hypothetical protein
MKSVKIDHFGSVTAPLKLTSPLEVADRNPAKVGQVVAVRALTENPSYPDLELPDGTRTPIRKGDVIGSVLGGRQALRGYVGYAPLRIAAGDRLQVLNLGGVIGRHVGGPENLGEPVQVEVLGISPRNLAEAALPKVDVLASAPPIILVAGSCMNVGKTEASAAIVRGLTARGLRVGAGKITGMASLKDTLLMEEAGAVRSYSFVDCGVPSTFDAEDVAGIARSIVAKLSDLDVVVLELGDGVVGHYRVDRFFEDRGLLAHIDAVVFCAADLTAAWGGREFLAQRGVKVSVFCGPVTDTEAGMKYLETAVGAPAVNISTHPGKLVDLVTPVTA